MILLVVSTHLKNISQSGNLPQAGVKIKNCLKPPPRFLLLHQVHGISGDPFLNPMPWLSSTRQLVVDYSPPGSSLLVDGSNARGQTTQKKAPLQNWVQFPNEATILGL